MEMEMEENFKEKEFREICFVIFRILLDEH